ncbi:MAG: NAD-dependent deacetylase [Lachnospiraceae bacterium]|nr:NAD-dependent deacetylase [Lachnospiraceae bacterium]
MSNVEQTIERVRNMVSESEKIVILIGVGTLIESGGENIWSSRECYRMEDIYHKTPDEMMSVEFYSTRRNKFFDFYKNEIIGHEYEPSSLYYDIKRLQDTGKVRKIITQNIDTLHTKAGLNNVVELHGNINNNWCPHCGKKFGVDYIKHSKSVPLCDECGTAIRPGIRLFGESIGNQLMTEAVNACEDADMILCLGTNMYDNMVRFCTEAYKGNRLVLITKEEHYMDKYANVVIHDNVYKVLPKIF